MSSTKTTSSRSLTARWLVGLTIAAATAAAAAAYRRRSSEPRSLSQTHEDTLSPSTSWMPDSDTHVAAVSRADVWTAFPADPDAESWAAAVAASLNNGEVPAHAA